MKTRFHYFFLLVLLTGSICYAQKDQATNHFFGDYTGVFTNKGKYPLNRPETKCVAQVRSIGKNKYIIRFMEAFDRGAGLIARTGSTLVKGEVVFKNKRAEGKIAGHSLKGRLRYQGKWMNFDLKKVARSSPTLGAQPSREGIVLFDGTGFDEWQGGKGQPVQWKIRNGNDMEVVPRKTQADPKTDIYTKRRFTDVYLHLEFKLPLMAGKVAQSRANSGIIFGKMGEVQILDSYGREAYWDDCGALYRQSPPRVNASMPPMSWQTYDIVFHAPKYNKDGQRVKYGEITVFHNGKRIHYHYPLQRGLKQLNNQQKDLTVNIRLQDHGNVLWFRNIWAIDLKNNPDLPAFIKKLEQ